MTTPTPPAVPEPAHEGLAAHFRAWFERDVLPEIESVKGDVAKVRALAPELSTVANTVEALVKALAPGAAPEVAALVADAERAAAVIARIAGELTAAGM